MPVFLAFLALTAQADAPARLLAFAVDNHLTLAIGKFEPGHGWVKSTDFYAPPQPGDRFTLYGPAGKAAEVAIADPRPAYPDGTFAGWSARVSAWDRGALPFALAVAGAPLAADALEAIPPDNPDDEAIVARYLKSHGLRIDQPLLTQAYKIPREGPGQDAAVLLAHSDAGALSTEKEAAVYAVALLCWNDHGKGKVLPLASQTSFKPAGRTREAHEHLYGTRDFLRLLAVVDLDGDGWKEIVLYDAKDDATQIDVYSFNGRRARRVLSAYKPNYN